MIKTAPTPKSKRDLHPRAQLAYHQRCAARAQSKADWLRELADRWEADDREDRYETDPEYAIKNRAEADALHAKVLSHLKACVVLNDEHDLGFLVTVSMRQMVGA